MQDINVQECLIVDETIAQEVHDFKIYRQGVIRVPENMTLKAGNSFAAVFKLDNGEISYGPYTLDCDLTGPINIDYITIYNMQAEPESYDLTGQIEYYKSSVI